MRLPNPVLNQLDRHLQEWWAQDIPGRSSARFHILEAILAGRTEIHVPGPVPELGAFGVHVIRSDAAAAGDAENIRGHVSQQLPMDNEAVARAALEIEKLFDRRPDQDWRSDAVHILSHHILGQSTISPGHALQLADALVDRLRLLQIVHRPNVSVWDALSAALRSVATVLEDWTGRKQHELEAQTCSALHQLAKNARLLVIGSGLTNQALIEVDSILREWWAKDPHANFAGRRVITEQLLHQADCGFWSEVDVAHGCTPPDLVAFGVHWRELAPGQVPTAEI